MSGDPSSVLGRNAISLWAENGWIASTIRRRGQEVAILACTRIYYTVALVQVKIFIAMGTFKMCNQSYESMSDTPRGCQAPPQNSNWTDD